MTYIISIQRGCIQSVFINRLKAALKNVQQLGFLQDKHALTPKILHHAQQYCMEDFSRHIQVDVDPCETILWAWYEWHWPSLPFIPSSGFIASLSVVPRNNSSNSFSSAAVISPPDVAVKPGPRLRSFFPSSMRDSRMDAEALSWTPVEETALCTFVVAANFISASNWCWMLSVIFSGVHKLPDYEYEIKLSKRHCDICSYLEYTVVTNFGCLVFFCATDIACPAEIVAIKACMAAFLSLHRIIASKKKFTQNKHNFLLIFTVPCNNARLCCITANIQK